TQPRDAVEPALRSPDTGQRGAGRSGHVVLRHGRPPIAAGRHLHRSTPLGLNRLHAARGAGSGGGPSRSPDGVIDRRRGRTVDRAGTRHLLPGGPVAGHRGGQQ
ncbi:hypothetical protein NJB1728910S_03540, partial [Mycobacterium marinum]